MTLQLTIRRTTIDDAEALRTFATALFRATFGPQNSEADMEHYVSTAFSPDAVRRELADQDARYWLIEDAGSLVGYSATRVGDAPAFVQASRPMEIVRLYADPAWHGRGIGAQLMARCLDDAMELAVDRIWLGVWEHNARAIAFYKKWGFTAVGDHTFRLGNDRQRDLVMVRPPKS